MHHNQNAYLNRNAFKLLLKILKEALFLNCNGRSFHSFGAQTENALSLYDFILEKGTTKKFVSKKELNRQELCKEETSCNWKAFSRLLKTNSDTCVNANPQLHLFVFHMRNGEVLNTA